MSDKVMKIAKEFTELSKPNQEIAMKYLENLLLGKTKENAEIRKSLGMRDRRTD